MIDRSRCAALAALALMAFAAPVLAQSADEAQSRALFDQARALADQGRWADACPRFQAAHDIHATGGTALQTANCYEKVGKTDRAIEMYQYILDHKQNEKNTERIKIAEERIRVLKGGPATPPPPVPAPSTPASTPPPPTSTSSPPLAPTTSPMPPEPDEGSSKVPAFVALGAGGAGLVVGAVFGVLALGKASSAKDACKSPPDAATGIYHCNPSGQSDSDTAKTFGVVSTIGFGVGIAGAGAGLILLATSGKSSKTATATANGFTIVF